MNSLSRRAFAVRALTAAAATSAVAAGLSPAVRAQTGSLGSIGSPTTPATPGGEAGLVPQQLQGDFSNFTLTPEQLAELDTGITAPQLPASARATTRTNPFRTVASPAGAYVQSVVQVDDRTQYLRVWSPANQRSMRIGVMAPPATAGPRPTLYCLDGYQEFTDENDDSFASAWYWAGGGNEFFKDKNLNVVFTVDGGPTMYRDFVSDKTWRGPIKWETFLTKELPPLINQLYNGNGRNGIIGISSGATAAFMTAVRNRNLYTTVAGFSGIYDVDNTFGKALWSYMWRQKKIDPTYAMGGLFNGQWMPNDPYAIINGNTQSLRGKTVYISAAAGLATGQEWSNVQNNPNPVFLGGPYEGVACNATMRYGAWLSLLGVRVTQDYRLFGVHDWPLWKRQLPLAWPTLAKGLGVDGQAPAPNNAVLR